MAGHDDDLSLSPDADTVEGHATALDPAYRLLASQSRFEVRRKLGSGGMGSVFEVYDRERGELVALKTIPRARSAHLIAFKQEFRALADIAHPNLVTLHELLCIDEQWMLSMDRVDGCRFDEYGVDLGQADEGAAEALGS